MNTIQQDKLKELQKKIGRSLEPVVEDQEIVFVNVDGVTVTIGPKGACGIPSVRSYDGGPETAASGRLLWNKQKLRDGRDPSKARNYTTGHFNPIVGIDGRCSGDAECPCQSEDFNRRKQRSFGKT